MSWSIFQTIDGTSDLSNNAKATDIAQVKAMVQTPVNIVKIKIIDRNCEVHGSPVEDHLLLTKLISGSSVDKFSNKDKRIPLLVNVPIK